MTRSRANPGVMTPRLCTSTRVRLLVLICLALIPGVLAPAVRKRPAAALSSSALVSASIAAVAVGTRTVKQASEAVRRRALLVVQPEGPDSLSFLEKTAVKSTCQKDYVRRIQLFVEWCRLRHQSWSSDHGLDNSLCLLGDEMFFKGDSVEEMSKLVSALKHFVPAISARGQGGLPRINRVLTSWRRLAPSSQRLPLPLVALCAMMAVAVARGKLEDAIRWFVQFRTYLRPGECDLLMGKNLVRPQPLGGPQYQWWGLLLHKHEDCRPSKTFMTDEAVLIDTDPWLAPFLEAIKASRADHVPLWQSSVEDNIALFNLIAKDLGLDALKPSRYALRHGGASEDLLTGKRDLASIKRRGRWVNDSSLRRYGKETRLLSEVAKIPVAALAFGRVAMSRLPDILLGRYQPAQPS